MVISLVLRYCNPDDAARFGRAVPATDSAEQLAQYALDGLGSSWENLRFGDIDSVAIATATAVCQLRCFREVDTE
jgi:hypothetical protein